MIRPIQKSDAAMIKNICESELGHNTTSSVIEKRIEELALSDNYYIAVFEDENTGKTVAFIQAEKYNLLYGENGFNIIALAVVREFQGKGIGKKLLESLENRAKELGYSFIRLNSNVIRSDAHGFYEHLGYFCDKTQKRFIKNID